MNKHISIWNTLPDGTKVPMGRRAGVRLGQTCYFDIGSAEYKALVDKFGEDSTKKMKEMGDSLSLQLNKKYEEMLSGVIKKEDFDLFKTKELSELNVKLQKMDDDQKVILKEQGIKINELLAGQNRGVGVKAISIKEFLDTQIPKIKELRKAGAGFYEITSDDLRKAGVVNFSSKAAGAHSTLVGTVGGTDGSIVNTVSVPGSPYLPGLGGSDLELFEIVRNPNFILNRVDVGTTNQSRLAWINEVEFTGTVATNLAEGAAKPLLQHKFIVEYSVAKKAAAYIELTEEFEDDVPGLATAVRRMLQADVLRAFDDAIQAYVISVARPYEITGLTDQVTTPTLFDALGALLAQIGFYNFIPNTLALNPVTHWLILMSKDSQGRYLDPPFIDRIDRLLVEANKVAIGFGLAGDLSQVKVDIYKDFTLRIGWINDQLILNKFSIVGELRYHSYISDSRKKAIVYNALAAVRTTIDIAV